MRFIAGIVLYNPDIKRLQENLTAVALQVDRIVLIDNSSANIDTIESILSLYNSAILIKNHDNLGIAKALNQICEYADRNNYEWVLSLDQDSVLKPGLIDAYANYLKKVPNDVAMLTCYVRDRNFDYENSKGIYTMDVDFCITSGSLLRLNSWKEIGKYDENFFIDRVDTDICHRLIVAKKRIVKINYVGILHEIGNKSMIKKLFNKQIIVFNHSPFRVYYIVRNSIYYAYKHRRTTSFFANYFVAYNRLLIIILFEKDKLRKLSRGIKGIVDGHKMIYKLKDEI